MTVFIDTSAFYAVLDGDDENHASAAKTWANLLRDEHTLMTTNYVLLETSALLQNRLGIPALRTFHQDIVPVLQIEWISEERHFSGVEAALAASRKRLSVVDCVAFQTMRENGVQTAFCFDRHFAAQGFTILPR